MNRAARATAQMLLLKPAIWGILSVQVHGLEHLEVVPDDGAFIVVGNHSSHFDAPLIFGALPRRLSGRMSTAAAADYFFRHWYTAGPTALFFNAFPVDRHSGTRNRKGLAGQLLGDGVPLLIFPEGTRSRTGGMSQFVPGAAGLSIKHGAPIVPVALVGAFAAWPAGSSHWVMGRPKVHVVFGSPISPQPGEIAEEFSERMRRTVSELHDSVAFAYGLPTQPEMQQAAAIAAKRSE
ncbi:MAG: 1-acyl-sn-glycerol-3-phosphate acyltransferase [Propionibacteriaceae bacterium]|nr:1-acyl-sn-glycerol-3-phosphate acyltransferase [Propionibacteriaceae bacterium]